MELLRLVSRSIDSGNELLGRALAWLVLFLVVVTAAVALLRYIVGVGWVWMQDAYIWSHAAIFLMGSAYTLLHDKHVRVDFIYAGLSCRAKAAVDIFGVIAFLFPTLVVIMWSSGPYVMNSWRRLEGALDPGGMPGVFVLKSLMIAFCIPLGLQGFSMLLKSLQLLLVPPRQDEGRESADA